MSAIVTDCEERIGLSILRSLGRKDIEVTGSSETKWAAGFYSKYCKKRFLYPSPQNNINRFVKEVSNFVKRRKPDVLIPVSDYTTLPVSAYRKMFEPYTKVPLVEHATLVKTFSKFQTIKIAEELGIPCPKTFFIKSLKDVDVALKELEYPIVIKPEQSKFFHKNKIISQQVQLADSKEVLLRKCKNFFNNGVSFLLQEFVPGTGCGFFGLFNDSDIRAYFMHRRIREFPIGRGASVFRESFYDTKIKKYGMELLENLKWHGVAMVEFRIDNRDKKPKLMEVNGRFWGSLPLAIASGVDFPFMLYKMVTEGDIEPVFKYKIGVKCRWLIGDIYHLIDVLTEKYDKKILGEISKTKTILDFLKFYEKDMAYDIFSIEDLKPSVVNLFYSFNRAVNYLRKRGFP